MTIAYSTITSVNGPIRKIYIGIDTSFQVIHVAGTAGQITPVSSTPADAGLWMVSSNILYGPTLSDHPSTSGTAYLPAGSVTAYTSVSQSQVIDSGASNGIYQIITENNIGTLRITQVDSYLDGATSWRTDYHFDNEGANDEPLIIYRAADVNLNNSSTSYGTALSSQQAPQIASGTASATANWFRMYPVSLDNCYYENTASAVWTHIRGKTAFPNTAGSALGTHDAAAGLSWSFTVPAGARVTRSAITQIQITPTAPPAAPTSISFRGYTYQMPPGYERPLSGVTIQLKGNNTGFSFAMNNIAQTVSDASGFWNIYRESVSYTYVVIEVVLGDHLSTIQVTSGDGSVEDPRILWTSPSNTVHSDNNYWLDVF